MDAVVIGAGVIGLTSGICLLEAGVDTNIVTAELGKQTTSAAAGAMWGPDPVRPEIARESLRMFTELASDSTTGVHLCRGFQGATFADQIPPFLRDQPEFEELSGTELPAGFGCGAKVTVPLVDMSRYLPYLQQRFERLGGTIKQQKLNSIDEVRNDASVVVNCSGVGARELVPDETVRAIRGQHVVVENPGIDEFFFEASLTNEWAGFFPHGERVVLGGVAMPDDYDLEPSPAVAAGIVERCAKFEPRLASAPVIEHQVGLRPGRPSVRLEKEPTNGSVVVHNYGHGAVGVSMSWGCAREVARLVTDATA
jgi:D-amino-acid oxidase